VENKERRMGPVKYWEMIADNLKKARSSSDYVSAVIQRAKRFGEALHPTKLD
jgi:hypothetical protein